MDSQELARFIESTGGTFKPWLLAQLRLAKLQEQRQTGEISLEEYEEAIADLHQDVMNLGEWWKGIEDEVF
ncbi:hypothetical protein H6G89_05755 [Oscillatoria sp. FACHB-1407]|uniref:hypothetical protein n=1 Tax=Oscillatoria sp. FACHB-1407 TaxID=2692847 RepID=UPI001684E139|nr:hypothetical protein [Oscillatoria sp. FACHB-1407]MBD2460545.1 hypothetical protein [Oscillatoria sp. FACHB-1407]